LPRCRIAPTCQPPRKERTKNKREEEGQFNERRGYKLRQLRLRQHKHTHVDAGAGQKACVRETTYDAEDVTALGVGEIEAIHGSYHDLKLLAVVDALDGDAARGREVPKLIRRVQVVLLLAF